MNAPRCKDILNLIPLYVDNLLDDEQSIAIKEHIDQCPNCKKELDFMMSVMAKTKELPKVTVSPDFSTKVTAKAKLQKLKKQRAVLLRRISSGVAVAAVLALCVVSFDAFDTKDAEPKTTPILSAENLPESNINDTPQPKESKGNARAVSEKVAVPDLSSEVLADKSNEAYTPALFSEVELTYYTIATVEITEENEQIVRELTKDYEKDDTGYIVPDMSILLRKFTEAGIKIKTEVSPDITCDYIVIE